VAKRDEREVSSPDGAPDVTLLILRPARAAGPLPAIYHIHGGGMVAGDCDVAPGGVKTRIRARCGGRATLGLAGIRAAFWARYIWVTRASLRVRLE